MVSMAQLLVSAATAAKLSQWSGLHEARELERRDGSQRAPRFQRGVVDNPVERSCAVFECLPYDQLITVQRRIDRERSNALVPESDERERIVRAENRMHASSDQLVRERALGRVYRAGDRADIATEVRCVLRRVPRTALLPGLDDD